MHRTNLPGLGVSLKLRDAVLTLGVDGDLRTASEGNLLRPFSFLVETAPLARGLARSVQGATRAANAPVSSEVARLDIATIRQNQPSPHSPATRSPIASEAVSPGASSPSG